MIAFDLEAQRPNDQGLRDSWPLLIPSSLHFGVAFRSPTHNRKMGHKRQDIDVKIYGTVPHM